MRQVEKILGECVDCGVCLEECLYLKKMGKSPIELASAFKEGFVNTKPEVAYSCFICELCATVCPQGLNIGDMCMEAREMMVEEGIAPLKVHKLVQKDQEYVNSDAFVLTQPNKHYRRTADNSHSYAYFPGCSLCGYSPQLVVNSYEYLKGVVPCSGIVLHCCGAPSLLIGQKAKFEIMMADIVQQVKKLGTSTLVVACPDCYHTIGSHIKDYDNTFEVTTIYHIMADRGLPAVLPEVKKSTLAVHDSCKARHDSPLQNAVRSIILQLGHTIDEMSYSRELTHCCGNGGMVPYVDQDLYKREIESILSVTKNSISTYCAGCRETLATVSKSVTHVLDLVFNSNWQKDISNQANTGRKRRENQGLLKKTLL